VNGAHQAHETRVRVCTIIARNYLPQARVLATSFRELHPGAPITVLVIDDLYAEVDPAGEPFDVVRPDDLGLDPGEFHRMAMIYDVTELATSLKPWLLRYLLRPDAARAVVYLDPDIRVYGRLDEVFRLAERHGIVLTPHVIAPIPRDGKLTDEDTILRAGMYNLGFIAVGRQAQPFLDFWMERLRRDCRVDPLSNRFVDQRWVDFVPSLFDCHILRDPTYNVAYWNLDQRELRWTDGGYTVDGLPLHFFHFSAFDPTEPTLLSRWVAERPRVNLSDNPDLVRIFGEYADALRASARPGEAEVHYGFAELPNGVAIPRELRSLYRDRLVEAERDGPAALPDPFSPEGAEELLAWAAAPEEGTAHILSRYLVYLRARRADIQAAFPEQDGARDEAYLEWAQAEVAAGRLPSRLVPVGHVSHTSHAAPTPTGVVPERNGQRFSLVDLASSRADPTGPSRIPIVSGLLRRLIARLTAHGDAHRAAVDVRLAEAILALEARLDEIAAAEVRAADHLGRLDIRLRTLAESWTRRPEHLDRPAERPAADCPPRQVGPDILETPATESPVTAPDDPPSEPAATRG